MDEIGQIGKRISKKDEAKPFLIDDIIINILNRLPVKNAMQCRLVCSRWRDLTMDRDFVDLHCRNRIPPMILVANPRYTSGLDLFSLDKWWEPARKRLMFHKFPFYSGNFPNTLRALFSHAGLVAFREGQAKTYTEDRFFIILNPSRLENVRITISYEFWKSEIYGVFFHPALNEYCSLWNIGSPISQSKRNHFKILNLGLNPSFKTISYTFDHKYKWPGSYTVFVDKYIYWMLEPERINMKRDYTCNDIMEYSIISEEFRVISCQFSMGNLLNIDGTLSYVSICPIKITIWKMKNLAEQLWTSNEYTFPVEIFAEPQDTRGWWEKRRALAVVDGKLALMSDKRLHVCNLMEGTVKNYQKSKYCCMVLFLPHQMSLASLKNCKPRIFINKDGNVVES